MSDELKKQIADVIAVHVQEYGGLKIGYLAESIAAEIVQREVAAAERRVLRELADAIPDNDDPAFLMYRDDLRRRAEEPRDG